MAAITLERAGPERRRTFENLFQLYIHDFSEQWWDRPTGELGEEGLYSDYDFDQLDAYWRIPGYEALLIRADGKLAGFALVDQVAHSGRALDYSVAEFFVARKYRRAGVGFAAACDLISARPGLWEMAIARRNVGALHFWRRVAQAIGPETVEERDHEDGLWNGAILRVVSG